MKKEFVCIFYINSCVTRMRMHPSDSDSNNRAEKCANQEKWLAGCFNPISGSGAKSRNYPSLFTFSVSFFRALYFHFFRSILRKFQTLSIVTIYQTLVRLRRRIMQSNQLRLTTGLFFPHDGYQYRDR